MQTHMRCGHGPARDCVKGHGRKAVGVCCALSRPCR